MTTYRMVARPQSSVVTMEFDYYNEAQEFFIQSAALSPTKPWKRGVKWCVSFTRKPEPAKYVKINDWYKPFPGYDEWKGVEALYHLPVPVPMAQPKVNAEYA